MLLVASIKDGNSSETAGDNSEEGGDDVKSSCPLCLGLHTYYNDAQYNEEQMAANTIPSIKGYEEQITDENMKVVADVFFNASNVQLWYDQYLPASVTEAHKNCMTELFGLTKTPQEIGEMQDAAMAAAREN